MNYRLPRARPDSPPPCGEGLGVTGTPTSDILQSPPPCPSRTRAEATLGQAPHLKSNRRPSFAETFA
jgi:hypothetical protein